MKCIMIEMYYLLWIVLRKINKQQQQENRKAAGFEDSCC